MTSPPAPADPNDPILDLTWLPGAKPPKTAHPPPFRAAPAPQQPLTDWLGSLNNGHNPLAPPVHTPGTANASDKEHNAAQKLATDITALETLDTQIDEAANKLGDSNNATKQKLLNLKKDIENHIQQFKGDKRPAIEVDRDVLAYSSAKFTDMTDVLKGLAADTAQTQQTLENIAAQQPILGAGLGGTGGGDGSGQDSYGPADALDALGGLPGMLGGSAPPGAGSDSGLASMIPGMLDGINTDSGDHDTNDGDGSTSHSDDRDPADTGGDQHHQDDPKTLVTLPDGTPATAPSPKFAAAARAYLSGVPLDQAAAATGITMPDGSQPFQAVPAGTEQAFDVAVYNDRPNEMLISPNTGMLAGQQHPKTDLVSAPGFAGFYRPHPTPAATTPTPHALPTATTPGHAPTPAPVPATAP